MSVRFFEIVAPETTQTKIVGIARTAFRFGRDVVNGEVVSGQTRLRAAIFT